MATYPEYKGLDLPSIDQEILSFWKRENIFQKSIETRSEADRFVFYEGPPSANGKPGIHHVMARTIKDLFCRFQTLQGKRVERKGGWDTHGLPIELKVEKELGITKEDIGTKISVDDYNKACRETVMRYKDEWDDLTRKMGYWVDLDKPYITFDNDYIESVWWLLKQLYDKDLLYKGYTVQPYSPAAGTGLSSHELNMPGAYQDVKDTSVVAQFRIPETDASAHLYGQKAAGDLFFIAWTTTPWTLPSNVALAVGKKIDYALLSTYNQYTGEPINIILAEALISKWYKPGADELSMDGYQKGDKKVPYRVLAKYTGADLEGIRYEQLMPYVQPDNGDAFKVLIGDFVSTSDGTGIVHIAPSFGSDDMRVGKQNGMGALTLVDTQGKFVEAVTDFAGRYVKDYKDDPDYKDVNVDIAIKLKTENRAFNVQKYGHNYPHCWRTDKPILYYPLDSWFIKTTAVKDKMVALNKTINWKPAHTGEGRFGNWLENIQDWNLSRSRYWGIPLPIWRTDDKTEQKCIGSFDELSSEIQKANAALGLNQSLPSDPHRPYIDEIILVSDSGQPMMRELDLIDVWFDSGSMPFAQWHYPFGDEAEFTKAYPADFISEGVDQTRGWFYSLHAISAMVMDSVAYKNVVSTGLVLDKNGVKMSKRLGNAIDPFDAINTHGADVIRWYMISNANPWDNLKFDMAGVEEVKRKLFGTLYNTYSFFALYANIDLFQMDEYNVTPIADRQEIDRWIISKLNSLIKSCTEAYADYEPTKACREIDSFVQDHLSNWYVRLCRRRFWKGEMSADKKAAYETLYQCLMCVAQLMSPVSPFIAEWLYKNLSDGIRDFAKSKETPLRFDSIHLTQLVHAQVEDIDQALEQRMDYAQRISSLIHSLRRKEKLRVRQPLKRILLPVLDKTFEEQVRAVEPLILSEVNVKTIEYVSDASGVIKKKIKPNFKTLGKTLGNHMKAGAAAINALGQDDIVQIEKTNSYVLEIEDASYELTLDDFEIVSEDIPGWQVATDKEITVALDIAMDDDLISEGLSRELVNRIQNQRKAKDFNVTDRIIVHLQSNDHIDRAVKLFGDYIKNEVLADEIALYSSLPDGEYFELTDDVDTRIMISVVS